MSLSRKRRRELKKLKKLTNKLVGEQRVVLDHAGGVLAEAGLQARHLSDEHLAPRAQRVLDRVRPTVNAGVDVARGLSRTVCNVATPVASSAVARAVSALEAGNQKDAAKRLQKFGESNGLLKKQRGIAGTFALLIGLVTAGAIGYSLWQAFRDDDELWVAPEQES